MGEIVEVCGDCGCDDVGCCFVGMMVVDGICLLDIFIVEDVLIVLDTDVLDGSGKKLDFVYSKVELLGCWIG